MLLNLLKPVADQCQSPRKSGSSMNFMKLFSPTKKSAQDKKNDEQRKFLQEKQLFQNQKQCFLVQINNFKKVQAELDLELSKVKQKMQNIQIQQKELLRFQRSLIRRRQEFLNKQRLFQQKLLQNRKQLQKCHITVQDFIIKDEQLLKIDLQSSTCSDVQSYKAGNIQKVLDQSQQDELWKFDSYQSTQSEDNNIKLLMNSYNPKKPIRIIRNNEQIIAFQQYNVTQKSRIQGKRNLVKFDCQDNSRDFVENQQSQDLSNIILRNTAEVMPQVNYRRKKVGRYMEQSM